jgi:serine protease AprX
LIAVTEHRGRRAGRLLTLVVAAALLLGLVPPASAAEKELDASKLEPALASALAGGKSSSRYRVIVARQPARDRSERRARESEIEAELRADGATVGARLGLVNGQSATMTARQIAKLSRHRRVKSISLDHKVTLHQITTAPLTGTVATGLASLETVTANAPAVWAQGNTGQGVTVAVLDSGVAPSADLPTAVFGVDVVTGTTALADPGGHGTHVAGIVAGSGALSGGVYKGVAPGARVLAVKVTTDDGRATYSNIIKGLQWVVANAKAQNIKVVNLSLGARAVAGYAEDPLNAAVEIAWFRGITVVASAGNEGPGPSTIAVPGNDPYIVTVGAYDDNLTALALDDLLPSWTSRGPTPFDGLGKPDLVASGRRVVSLRSVGSHLDQELGAERVEGNGKYFRLSGTSMATPVVAGTVALMLAANPRLTPNEVKYILKQSARPMVGGAQVVGAGAVDALAAVQLAKQGVGLAKANKGQTPNRQTATAVWGVLKTMKPVWRTTGWYGGRYWSNAGWDVTSGFRTANGSWDDAGWDATAWANLAWEEMDWSDSGWDDAGWDALTWNDAGWDSGGWDSAGWDNGGWNSSALD